MAGAIAEGVIGTFTTLIVQQAAKEVALVYNFTREFEWLKEELTSISGCLASADLRAVRDKAVKLWLHRVRDVAWEAEDIVEECAVRPLHGRCVTQSCGYNPDELLFRNRVGKRIEEMKEKIKTIKLEGERLTLFRNLLSLQGQSSSSAKREEGWKGNSLPPRDSHPVAIESKLENLKTLIEQPTNTVIAVVGMAGSGKTFLLQNLFQSNFTQNYKHAVWLSISQSYLVRELQCDLASQLGDLKYEVKDVSKEQAAKLIHDRLQGKESLVVLDDVWRADGENDIISSLGLPVGRGGNCKVVVTTRSKEVCDYIGASTYDMNRLSETESWQLFCAHAFGGGLPPSHLSKVAHDVEKECAKLPLALKVIGASLFRCIDKSKWDYKLRQLREVIDRENDQVIQALRLSYEALPAALKPCFSYLSFFPENEDIDCEYLINLWIGEGLVQGGGGAQEDQWDVAWDYLDQLASRCLIDVWEDKNLFKYCKVHDLLLDLAIDISKENRCIFAVDQKISDPCRIFLAKKEINDNVIVERKLCCSRSLRTVSLCSNPISEIGEIFFGPMRLLRVLDLSLTGIANLPRCVGKLKLLKVLNLSWTKIRKIPICVKGLKSLLLLNLSGCQELQTLPEWINELRCLQHLNIMVCCDQLRSRMPKGIAELGFLRVLRSDRLRFSVEEDGLLKLEDLAKLTGLQELSLQVRNAKELKSIEDVLLGKLRKMRHLSIKSDIPGEPHPLESVIGLSDLRTLKLNNFAVPHLVYELTNLKQLILWGCECKNYPALENMPHLTELRLLGNESCTELPKGFGTSFGFPKLRFLTIKEFAALEELPDLQNGAMAVLEEFILSTCPKVKRAEGLERLKRLRWFYYAETGTKEFRARLSKRGEVREKIEAGNPQVRIEGYNVDSFS